MPPTHLAPPSSSAKVKVKTLQQHIKQEEWLDVLKVSKEVLKDEKGQGMASYHA
jgi:hypothetical protein